MARYDHLEIEKKWQEVWEKTQLFLTDEKSKKEKYYSLVMFPYPSGDLHIGHWYNFSGGDFYSKYMRMRGYNLMQPIGFDSFGLPAENAAIKRGIAPKKWTYDNIDNMVKQLKRMGSSFDWDRMVRTSDPEYYKWTQWMFLELYKRGLAYKKKQVANWCPGCNTVLANEQVVNGACERCDSEVVQKDLDQWLFKITDYAEELINDLDKIDWPETTKTMQRNWIGKSEGAKVKFPLVIPTDSSIVALAKLEVEKSSSKNRGRSLDAARDDNYYIEVFTTRIDTLFGATFMVLAPENPLVEKISTADQKRAVEKYIEETKKKTELERQQEKQKTGVFTGAYAINPVNDEKIPVWISDYVLMGYGTGAIMAVPAHDERDFEFAKKFDLPITQVIMPCEDDPINPPQAGFEMVERPTVVVHLRDKATGKYALLDWHGTLEGISTAIMGGIEDGQTPEEAALSEIGEEAGLAGVNIVKKLRWITGATYCASHKKQNRKAVAYGFLVEVDNLSKQGAIDDKEKAIHSLIWVDKEEVLAHLTPIHQKLVWTQLNHETSLDEKGDLINSAEYDGLTSEVAKEKILAKLAKEGKAEKTINYKLRDWLISRQRYWGAPIPIVYCEKCGEVPVAESELPVLLPEEVSMKSTGESPLKYEKEFYETKCPKCSGKATRETDTMDTFVCSSWYYLRYTDPKNSEVFASKAALRQWMPVDMYIGGAEHSVLHLLYSRFFTKALRDGGFLEFDEPFMKLRHQGMILGPDGLKMSKSKGNVIDPDIEVDKYGADAVRMYLAFMGPYDQGGPWNPNGLKGVRRFLDDIYSYFMLFKDPIGKTDEEKELLFDEWVKGKRLPESNIEIQRALSKLIKKVTGDIESLKFNTAISEMMSFKNLLYKEAKSGVGVSGTLISAQDFRRFLLVLAPIAPFIAEELWQEMDGGTSVHAQDWPAYDENLVIDELISVAVQVNGKVRDSLLIAAGSEEKEVLALAEKSEKVSKYLESGIKKSFYVKDKILSIVTN